MCQLIQVTVLLSIVLLCLRSRKMPVKIFYIVCLASFLVTGSGCSLLQVRDTQLTLPVVPMMEIRSQGKPLGFSMGTGLGSHYRTQIYSNVFASPFESDESADTVHLGRIQNSMSLGIFDFIDFSCAGGRCALLWDISRVWNLPNWVISISAGQSFEHSNEAYDSNLKEWARSDLQASSKTVNIGYLLTDKDLVYGSITNLDNKVTTVLHLDPGGTEIGRKTDNFSSWQLTGGFEREFSCRLVGVKGCFKRVEVGFSQQPKPGLSQTQWLAGLGLQLGVRW